MKKITTLMITLICGLSQLGFSQNFGIGIATPNTLLHVNGAGTFGNSYTPTATEGENILNLVVGTNADGASNGIAFYENNSGYGMKIGYDGTGSGAGNVLRIYDATDSELVTFQQGGNVGIGIASPAEKLDVSGNIRASGYVLSSTIGFFARVSTHQEATAVTYVAYDVVTHNIGGAYNSSNGYFTAPVRGLYQFCWGGINYPAETVSRSYLYKNGSNYAGNATQLRLDSGTEYGEGCNCPTVQLNAGDWVAINMNAGGLYLDYSWFSGHLISAY